MKNGAFYILNEIIENVTLVQLMDTLGNLNHTRRGPAQHVPFDLILWYIAETIPTF